MQYTMYIIDLAISTLVLLLDEALSKKIWYYDPETVKVQQVYVKWVDLDVLTELASDKLVLACLDRLS